MPGKSTVILAVIAACMVLFLCILPESAIQMVDIAATEGGTGSKLPAYNNTLQEPVNYVQDEEKLPDKDSVVSFPGIFDIMPLTLEQTIKVLGSDFKLIENRSQGYDTYVFPKYNLSIEFDKINKSPSTIWLDSMPYYIYSGDYKIKDINGDGKPEKIIAYEDINYNGQILVIDGASGQYSSAEIEYFGGKCELEIIDKYGGSNESLILARTFGGKEGNVFRWDKNKLISVLPENYDAMLNESKVSVEGDKAVLVNQKRNILYVCPLPERLADSVKGKSTDEVVRLNIKINPQTQDDSLRLKVRTIVQLKLADNYNFIDGSYGTYCDVAQIVDEYRYEGAGKWKEISTDGGPRYGTGKPSDVTSGDLSIDKYALGEDTKSLDEAIKSELAVFTPDELNAGVLIKKDGLLVGITNDRITYLSVEDNPVFATGKGLKTGDDRQKVVDTYGLPDCGFNEDRLWTYYIVKKEPAENYLSSCLVETLNLEFTGDEVSRIWMSTYVADY